MATSVTATIGLDLMNLLQGSQDARLRRGG